MNIEQGNKIKVEDSTVVAHVIGAPVFAENLQCWAYRRLETWPDLLAALKNCVIDAKQKLTKKERLQRVKEAEALITKAEKK